MGIVYKVKLVKPICGVTFTPLCDLVEVKRLMTGVLGNIDRESSVFDFTYTDYYQKEMGTGLKKLFLSFLKLINPEEIAGIKVKTNNIEERLSIKEKRCVNLDPGYITGAKLVLASTKDFAHRIYIGKSIYGDVQLQFIRGSFRSQIWTYPDYQSNQSLEFFHEVRSIYIEQEKRMREKNEI
jgi:hypothetical protein